MEMSQRNVQFIIGRLATNPDFRRSFAREPEAALYELCSLGIRLTNIEINALAAIDLEALDQLAEGLDPRIRSVGINDYQDTKSADDL